MSELLKYHKNPISLREGNTTNFANVNNNGNSNNNNANNSNGVAPGFCVSMQSVGCGRHTFMQKERQSFPIG